MPRPERTARLVAAITCTALVLAACGGDTDDDARGDASTEFCDAALAVELAPEPEIDFETASEAEIGAAVQGFGADVLRPLADDVVAVAPAAIAAEVEVLSDAVDELAAGNPEAMETPDAKAASDAFDDFVDDECGWTSLSVTATDYEFTGIPESIDAGPTRFRLTNDGEEAHEVLVFRRNAGTDQPVDELLSLPDEEALALVTPIGAPAFATAGGSEPVAFDLTPGAYIVLCLIPVGTVDEDSAPAPDALPHAAHGMVAEFTVR